MNFKIHHVAFTVSNINQSIKWYQEKLEFIVIHQYKNNDMEIVHLKRGDVRIELLNLGQNTKPLPPYRNSIMDDVSVVGTKHLCMEVENLAAMIRELDKKGVRFTTKIDTTAFGGRYIFFKDCNGILIELYQP